MSKVELTPAKLAELKQKAEAASANSEGRWEIIDDSHTGGWKLCIRDQRYIIEQSDVVSVAHTVAEVAYDEDAQHIAAADPATVLALVEEIERLRIIETYYINREIKQLESEAGQ